MSPPELLLSVDNLSVEFGPPDAPVRAVDGVGLSLTRGRIVGLVGESGSGKSITGLAIIRLLPGHGRVVSGTIRFAGEDVMALGDEALRQLRGARIAMVFQDPMMTLNPVLRIDTQMVETMTAHGAISRSDALERARQMMALVGIGAADARLKAYPHQLSGGMRQRVAIAIALLNEPDVIIADEPTTALDVTIQAQILAEVQALCEKTGVGLIWISHDLGVVAGLADDLTVMYAGEVVETGPCEAVLAEPAHPYTRGLIASSPSRNERGKPLTYIKGMMPSPGVREAGCRFRPRCPFAAPECAEPQPLRPLDKTRAARCCRINAVLAG